MNKKKEPLKLNLNEEENELMDSIEKDEWRSVKNLKKEKEEARKIAANTLKKDVRINIRLSSYDISAIKQKAAYEGLPYQTLISSVLHKYASGHLRQ